MGKKKEVPARSDLIDYNHSVAGHAGTMCDASGELFIKPCVQAETDFYQSANAEHEEFASLMPVFIGTLTLNDAAELSSVEEGVPGVLSDPEVKESLVQAVQGQTLSATPEMAAADTIQGDNVTWVPNKAKKIKTDMAVVLENASSGFVHANILDAKLGVRLWADDAPQQKKTRFDKITSETTHGTHGFRIAGMRVYRGSLEKSELDEEDYRVYDKDYGRKTANADNIVDCCRNFLFNPAAGIDSELGKGVAQAFVRELQRVEEVLVAHETRMYSASLLFVFEGDGQALRAAIKANNADVEARQSRRHKQGGEEPPFGRSNPRVDSGIALMDEDLDTTTGETGFDSDDDDEEPALPKIFDLKLIDFAHASWAPGEGPDENALKGVRSLIKIFEEMAA